MKKYLISLLITAIVFTSTSCSEDFLDTVSTENISAESATATTDNLNLIINGVYRLLYTRDDSNNRGGLTSMIIQHDYMGEDVVQNAQANGAMLAHARWQDPRNATDGDNLHDWKYMYRAIGNVNIVIEGAANATGEAADRNAALGQALYLRAFCHFTLVQLYAKRYAAGTTNSQEGVPIMLTPTIEPQPRATVEAVYTQINADLDEAITLLSGYTRLNPSHADQKVAQGLKARVALVQGNYIEAANMAVLARAGRILMDSVTYAAGFNDYDIDEWMWGFHYNEEQGSAFTNFMAMMSRNFQSNQIRGNPKSINNLLYNTIPVTDVRSAIFDPTGQHLNLPAGIFIASNHSKFPYTHQKFLAYSDGDSRGDVPLMRASEMYLIEAEALAKKAAPDYAGAAAALFTLAKARDASYTLSTNTGQDLIDEIDLQRRWELWGEGFRFADLKRQDKAMDRTGSNHKSSLVLKMTVPAGSDEWQWLIPQDEINANPLMTQNN